MSQNAAAAAKPLPPGLQVQDQCDGFLLGNYGNIITMFWKQPPSAALFDRSEPQLYQLADKFKDGFGLLVVAMTNKAPDAGMNARGSQIVKKCNANAIAYLFSDEGMVGKLLKLSMSLTFALSSTKSKGFTDPAAAAEYLCESLRTANLMRVQPRDLADVIAKTIAALK